MTEEKETTKKVVIDLDHATMISQGAEGRVYRTPELGAHQKTVIVKERFNKKYRHPELDKILTRQRLKSEAKNIKRAAEAGIRVPEVYYVDTERHLLVIEDLGTETVKQFLWKDATTGSDGSRYTKRAEAVCTELGKVIAALHDADIVHGDLTTSNFMICAFPADEEEGKEGATHVISPIDFGLSYKSTSIEDKAVDLYVLERAFLCTHLDSEALVALVLSSYKDHSKKGKSVINRLDKGNFYIHTQQQRTIVYHFHLILL